MFYGRKKELADLNKFFNNKGALAIIYGKRRVGKSSLIIESIKNREDTCLYFECIKGTLNENLDLLLNELKRTEIINEHISFNSLLELFRYIDSLGKKINLIIDEYPYLKNFEDSNYIDSIFQNVADNINNINILLCGSHIAMMKSLLVDSNPLFGRFSLVINLKPFNYYDASLFYSHLSNYDKVAFYAIFGGLPFIEAKINPEKSLRDNIINLILDKNSAVFIYLTETITTDLGTKENSKRIFNALKNSKLRYHELENKLNMERNGSLNKQLNNLLVMDLITKDNPINKLDDSKKSTYSISENSLRFFYTYVYGKTNIIDRIGKEAFYDLYIKESIKTFISYRFEDISKEFVSLLVINKKLKNIFNIGSYYYDDPKTRTNGEFDLVLETDKGYDFIEVKYLKNKVTNKIISDERNQLANIKGIEVNKYGFISINGFEEGISLDYKFEGSDIYF